ncbi:hypothetical protein K458DRAFT_486213 [Lentithecium fluviatile CBS 122367]|uniref:Secreted protein n=1 Tax=Lentithecium fluviatile CBS 122367 TaxID=1168545 RepID=A0A6G1J7J9_9PLEO|nr:hypothetical protein K458DRAFT_486213 [Lentithecium fluviatile CBS 122367]
MYAQFSSPQRVLFSLLALYVALYATLSASSPTISGRGLPGGVYLCSKPNFKGKCTWHDPSESAKCISLFDKRIRSIGPDERTLCEVFVTKNCHVRRPKGVSWPGENLGLPGFMSIKCVACEDVSGDTDETCPIAVEGPL